MNRVLQTSLVLITVSVFAIIISMIRKKKLQLKYSLTWLISSLLLMVFAVFPKVVSKISHTIGIIEDTNTIFLIMIFFLFFITFTLTVALSRSNARVRAMAQQIALLMNEPHNKDRS